MTRPLARSLACHVLDAAGMPWRHATEADVWQWDDGVKRARTVSTAPDLAARYRHSWDGRALLVTKERCGNTLLHELGHWLVCPLAFRRYPEYGLGEPSWDDILPLASLRLTQVSSGSIVVGPAFRPLSETEIEQSEPIASRRRWAREEDLAALVELHLLHELEAAGAGAGGNWRTAVGQLGRCPHARWAMSLSWEQVISDNHRWCPVGALTNCEAVHLLRGMGAWDACERFVAIALDRRRSDTRRTRGVPCYPVSRAQRPTVIRDTGTSEPSSQLRDDHAADGRHASSTGVRA